MTVIDAHQHFWVLAAHPNVTCKLSGILGAADVAHQIGRASRRERV